MKKSTKSQAPLAYIELNVAPSWWKDIHHRQGGAFPMAIKLLVPRLYERGLEPAAIRATQSELTVTVLADKDAVLSWYGELADWLRAELTKEITVEAVDMRSGILPDADVDPIEPTVTRSDLETVLRTYGMLPAWEMTELGQKPEDKDIWGTPDAEECVQFDERTGPSDTGRARLMTVGGERIMTFEALYRRYSGRTKATNGASGEQADVAGIFPADGQAHGGVFGKEGTKHG